MRLNEREQRSLRSGATELRASDDDDGSGKISGYAALFSVESDDLFFGSETIKPGAFTKTLKEADVRALWNHDSNFVLGRNTAGTLELREDSKGLFTEIAPPDTHWANDLKESIRRRDVTQMSFGFRTIRDEWHSKDDKTERHILEVELFDVSPVTFPAYPDTEVAVRSLLRHEGANNEEIEGLSDQLAALRDPDLTAVEFRSILDPITREIRTRQSAPGQRPHPEDDQQKFRTDSLHLALDLSEVE